MLDGMMEFNDDASQSSRTLISIQFKQTFHNICYRKERPPILSSFYRTLYMQIKQFYKKNRASISTCDNHFSFTIYKKQPRVAVIISI